MKIGVIGATGMIGNHTARAVVEKGYELTVIHRQNADLSRIKGLTFESRVGNLNDKQSLIAAFSGLDWVINCAAYYPTTPLPLVKEMQTAENQMIAFIDAIKISGIAKAVYVGGSIALPKSDTGIGDETMNYAGTPPNKTPYVQVKWLMDKMAQDAGKNGVPLVIGIPSMTFGEYDYGPTTGQLIKNLANKQMSAYLKGNRNVVYAGDAAIGLLLAAEKGKNGERYLITGENRDMDNLVTTIAKLANVAAPTKVIPLGIAKIISFVQEFKFKYLEGQVPTLSGTVIAILSAGQFLNGDKAKKELGYAPSVTVDEAIKRTIDWFKTVGYIHQ
jgi:dihydroflavonol-4-reductase